MKYYGKNSILLSKEKERLNGINNHTWETATICNLMEIQYKIDKKDSNMILQAVVLILSPKKLQRWSKCKVFHCTKLQTAKQKM